MCPQTLTQMPLSSPTSKEMRFEIYKEVKALSDPLVYLYFEVRRPACHGSALLSRWRCCPRASRSMLPMYMRRSNHVAGCRFRECSLYPMETSEGVRAGGGRCGMPRTDGRNLPSTGPRLALTLIVLVSRISA